MPRLSAVGISGLQAGEDVKKNWKATMLIQHLSNTGKQVRG